MARKKPSDLIQYKVRIREDLRQRIEQAAKKRDVSINYEIRSRLEQSFDREELYSLSRIASDMEIRWERFGNAFHKLDVQGDLLRASEALVDQLGPLLARPEGEVQNREAVIKAVARVQKAMRVIDNEAALARRQMHTTGSEQ
jgi:Arc-like DNA binding domain